MFRVLSTPVWPFRYLILNYKWRNEVFIEANQIELNCVLRCHDKVNLAYFLNEPLQFALRLSVNRTLYILLQTWILTLVACTLTYLSFWTSFNVESIFYKFCWPIRDPNVDKADRQEYQCPALVPGGTCGSDKHFWCFKIALTCVFVKMIGKV